jgi:hypothetical protein
VAKRRKTAKLQTAVSPLHPMLKWVRTAGIGAEFFGWGALLLTDWFWLAIALVYAGFVILAFDLWFEPELRTRLKWRIAGLFAIASLCMAFSDGVVFVSAPLEASGLWNNGVFPDNTVADGITWKPQFTELIIVLTNPTDRVYRDIDLVIRPTEPVAAIAQISQLSDVSLEDKYGSIAHVYDLDPTGVAKIIPLSVLATDAGYRVRCGRLPEHANLRLALALVDLKWDPHPKISDPVEAARRSDYVLRIKKEDFSTYWLGHPDGDVYVKDPSIPVWFKMEGQYFAAFRTRIVSQRVNISATTFSAKP